MENGNDQKEERGFLATLFLGLVRDTVKLVVAFCVGTGAGAIFCWYYGIPFIFSLVGGVIALGIAVAIWSDGIFS